MDNSKTRTARIIERTRENAWLPLLSYGCFLGAVVMVLFDNENRLSNLRADPFLKALSVFSSLLFPIKVGMVNILAACFQALGIIMVMISWQRDQDQQTRRFLIALRAYAVLSLLATGVMGYFMVFGDHRINDTVPANQLPFPKRTTPQSKLPLEL